MEHKEKKEKSIEITTDTSESGLISVDEFDNSFDDFLSHKWPRLVDWNFPASGRENGFPNVDIIVLYEVLRWLIAKHKTGDMG